MLETSAADAFRYILAHELVHVFDAMRYLVPACMDWQRFYDTVLAEGCADDDFIGQWECFNHVTDQYGQPAERERIREYWPSVEERWFEALEEFRSDMAAADGES